MTNAELAAVWVAEADQIAVSLAAQAARRLIGREKKKVDAVNAEKAVREAVLRECAATLLAQ